jgi:hypothetical protein
MGVEVVAEEVVAEVEELIQTPLKKQTFLL